RVVPVHVDHRVIILLPEAWIAPGPAGAVLNLVIRCSDKGGELAARDRRNANGEGVLDRYAAPSALVGIPFVARTHMELARRHDNHLRGQIKIPKSVFSS